MERRSPTKTGGEWLILAAAVLWGTTGTAQAFAPPERQPVGVGAVRLAIGGLALLAVAVGRGRLRSQAPWPVGVTLLAAICMAGYQLCFFAAVAATGVAVGTVVAIGSAPVLAGALGWLLNREKPGWRWGLATALAILGCALLVLPGGQLTLQAWGISLALGAGLCYALYALLAKRLLEGHTPEAVMAVVFCLGALLLAPALFLVDLQLAGRMARAGGRLASGTGRDGPVLYAVRPRAESGGDRHGGDPLAGRAADGRSAGGIPAGREPGAAGLDRGRVVVRRVGFALIENKKSPGVRQGFFYLTKRRNTAR